MKGVRAVVLSLFLCAPPAHACLNATVAAASENSFFLRKAEAALDRGDYVEGRRLGVLVRDRAGDALERERSEWVVAMSWVRDENAPRVELLAAVATMEHVRARRTPADVVSAVDLAEAYARFPEHEAEARWLLEPLVRADIVGSAPAYAALARIAVDEPTRQQALTRCRAMATTSELCERGFVASAEPRKAFAKSAFTAVVGALAAVVMLGVLAVAWRVRARNRVLLSEPSP